MSSHGGAYLEYLSSGEKRAGCADLVTVPSSTFFNVCHSDVLAVDWISGGSIRHSYIGSLASCGVLIVHQMHCGESRPAGEGVRVCRNTSLARWQAVVEKVCCLQNVLRIIIALARELVAAVQPAGYPSLRHHFFCAGRSNKLACITLGNTA